MNREVCLFDKFSYCKNGVRCRRVHLKETCLSRECDYRKCNKRHPRPCRFLMLNGFCRFGSSCRYSHRLPKNVEDQNEKIKAIEEEIKVQNGKIKVAENKNVTLEKMVENQNLTIRKLQLELSSQYEKEIEYFKKEIEFLKEANNEKEMSVRALEKSLNEMEENVESKDDDEVTVDKEDEEIESSDEYEDINEDEDLELEIPSHSSYVEQALVKLDETKNEIEKMRKNTRDAKVKIEKLSQDLNSLPLKCGLTSLDTDAIYLYTVREFEEFVKSNEAKMDKITCLTKIEEVKQQLQMIIF